MAATWAVDASSIRHIIKGGTIWLQGRLHIVLDPPQRYRMLSFTGSREELLQCGFGQYLN